MTARPANYSTKQDDAVLTYLSSLTDIHVTAAQVSEHFASGQTPIGRTTVYRQLDRPVQEGKARKYTIDGIKGACFRIYLKLNGNRNFFIIKCENAEL